MLVQWDIALRLIALGVATLLLFMVLTGDVRRQLRIALCGLLVGSGCYLLNSSPLMVQGSPNRPFIDLVSLFTPFFAWQVALHLFEREPHWRTTTAASLALLSGWFIGYFLLPAGNVGFYIIHLVALVLIADLLRNAYAGRSDDLIEKRRALRLWLPLLVAGQAGGVLLYELITGVGSGNHDPRIEIINVALILALLLFAGSALLQTDPELLVETVREPRMERSAHELSPSEIVLKAQLEQTMTEGFWRTEGLTIATLAARLDTPEHRLRALINRRLGYRNFSAFLNMHRIAEAKAILADRDRVDLPVLTIAMDLGYNSLPTFNRAFRELTGQTPTDFRRVAIGQN